MTEKEDSRSRSRRLWDNHGSWLIMALVMGLAFNGGREWSNYQSQVTLQTIVSSAKEERDDLRSRLRTVNDRNLELASLCKPAAQAAEEAARKATEAATKADGAVQKATQVIEANK